MDYSFCRKKFTTKALLFIKQAKKRNLLPEKITKGAKERKWPYGTVGVPVPLTLAAVGTPPEQPREGGKRHSNARITTFTSSLHHINQNLNIKHLKTNTTADVELSENSICTAEVDKTQP